MSRGSTAMSRQPRSTAARICMPMTGQSRGSTTSMMTFSALRVTSPMEFVIAPELSMVARPATGASNTRATVHVVRLEHDARHLLEQVDVLVRGARARERRQRLAAVDIAELREAPRHEVERFGPGWRARTLPSRGSSRAAFVCGRARRRNRSLPSAPSRTEARGSTGPARPRVHDDAVSPLNQTLAAHAAVRHVVRTRSVSDER